MHAHRYIVACAVPAGLLLGCQPGERPVRSSSLEATLVFRSSPRIWGERDVESARVSAPSPLLVLEQSKRVVDKTLPPLQGSRAMRRRLKYEPLRSIDTSI